jgi:hypothetical protein
MAEAQKLVSFNPDDASGLVDNLRGKVTGLVVNTFKAKSGESYVNIELTIGEHTEYYLLGNANEWAPNADKTGVISLKEGGSKIWNKSVVYKLFQSFVNAGFPKAKLSDNLAVLLGLDVLAARVTQDGETRKDQNGVERPKQVLLIKTIFTSREDVESGKYATASAPKAVSAKAAPKATAAPKAAASAPAAEAADDSYVAELLVEILSEAPNKTLTPAETKTPIFMKLTKAKKASLRASVQARIVEDAFLASLVEGGLISYDGSSISLAG